MREKGQYRDPCEAGLRDPDYSVTAEGSPVSNCVIHMGRVEKTAASITSLGGDVRSFPSTQGSWVGELAKTGPELHRRALAELCRRYWKAIYWYIRAPGTKTNEEAKDLTQAFILWLLEQETLRTYSPLKGRFRPFLKLVLKRFLGHEEEAQRRQKRGGGRRLIPIGEQGLLEETLSDPNSRNPEKEFDRIWAKELAERAIERVRVRLDRQGRSVKFQIYSAIDLRKTAHPPTYRDLARQKGLSENDVRNYLRDVRAMIREEIRGALSETVAHPGDLEAEWNELFRL